MSTVYSYFSLLHPLLFHLSDCLSFYLCAVPCPVRAFVKAVPYIRTYVRSAANSSLFFELIGRSDGGFGVLTVMDFSLLQGSGAHVRGGGVSFGMMWLGYVMVMESLFLYSSVGQ